MWPPQRVKTWRTPACRRVRATSCPPVRSAMSSLAARSARPESRDDLGGDRFVLGALVARIADGAHDEVVAAGGPEPLELLGALLGRADDAVALGERLEVLCVPLAEDADPRPLGGLIVAPIVMNTRCAAVNLSIERPAAAAAARVLSRLCA